MAWPAGMLGWLAGCALALALTGGAARGAANFPRQNPSRYTPAQWQAAFATLAPLPLPQRIACWADLAAVDAVYAADPLGEGPQSPPDTGPLEDLLHVDCVTYLEQVLALALSSTREAVADTLRRIRYRDGRVDFRWRNHYFISDWVPANAWCIRDVTAEVGGTRLKEMKKTISRGAFFAGKGLKQYANLPDETATAAYIPRDRLREVAKGIRTGDLIVFVVDTPGIIAGHVGLLRVQGEAIALQHAGQAARAVVTLPLADYLRAAPARFVGFQLLRPIEPALPATK